MKHHSIKDAVSTIIKKILPEKKTPLLEIKNLHAGYGNQEILRGVSLTVNKSEIVALIGPNGAGKSTVLKSIFAIAQVTGGDIMFKHKTINQLATYELLRAGISYVNQGGVVFGNLTVQENLLMGAELIKDQETIIHRIASAYARFPVLKNRAAQPAYSLSGGERAMLALGRALLLKPDLLMLDEPSLGLSPKVQKELFEMIRMLRDDEGVSILIVEQNAKQAIKMADRTFVLEDGIVVLQGGKTIIMNPKIKNVYLGGRY